MTDVSLDPLVQQVQAWLVQVRSTAIDLVHSAGLPTSTTVSTARAARTENGTDYFYGEEQVSILRDAAHTSLTLESVDLCRADAEVIIHLTNQQFPGAAASINPHKAPSPGGWTDVDDAWALVSGLGRGYAASGESIDRPDLETASRLTDEYVKLLQRGHATLLSSVPIDRPALSEPMVCEDVEIRELNSSELFNALSGRRPRFHWSAGEDAHEGSVVLEVRSPIAGRDFHKGVDIQLPLQKTALALELNELRLCTRTWASFTIEPTWIGSNRRGAESPFPKITAPGQLVTQSRLGKALQIRPKIPNESFGVPKSGHAAACYRFAVVTSRESDLDRLLDSVALLESITVPSDSQGELGYQVAMHGAWLLAPNSDESRVELHAQLKDLYKKRSKIAHGKGPGSVENLHDSAVFAYECARQALREVTMNGWPTERHFVELLLRNVPPSQTVS